VEVHQDAFKVRKLLFLARALICSFKWLYEWMYIII
jgi:hypothetical protein